MISKLSYILGKFNDQRCRFKFYPEGPFRPKNRAFDSNLGAYEMGQSFLTGFRFSHIVEWFKRWKIEQKPVLAKPQIFSEFLINRLAEIELNARSKGMGYGIGDEPRRI